MAKKTILLPNRGLDVSVPAEFVDPLGAVSVQNIETNRGIIRKRAGGSAFGLTLGERVMAYAELLVGEGSYLLRFGPTKVEQADKGSETWSDVTGTPLTGLDEDLFDFAFPVLSGNRIITFTNGIDAIRKYTGSGTTANLGGSPPRCRYMTAFGDYLMLFYVTDGGTVYPSRVQWCDTGNPEDWNGIGTGNAGTVDLIEDGENIRGASLFGAYVAVHKESSIYLGYPVSTSEVFRFERKSTGVGTLAHQTIKNLPNGGQIFLASDGLHIFDGQSAPVIDSRIVDDLRENINPLYVRRSLGVVVRELDEYWLCVPMESQTKPETVFKYNYKTGEFWSDQRPNLTAISTYTNTDDVSWDSLVGSWDSLNRRWDSINLNALNPTVIFGDSTGISTKRVIGLTLDSASAIDSQYTTKDFTAEDFGGETGRMVRFTGLQVWAKGDSVDVAYSTDGGTTWSDDDTLRLESDYPTDDAPLESWFDVVSTRIRFRFSNDTASETFSLKKYFILAQVREETR